MSNITKTLFFIFIVLISANLMASSIESGFEKHTKESLTIYQGENLANDKKPLNSSSIFAIKIFDQIFLECGRNAPESLIKWRSVSKWFNDNMLSYIKTLDLGEYKLSPYSKEYGILRSNICKKPEKLLLFTNLSYLVLFQSKPLIENSDISVLTNLTGLSLHSNRNITDEGICSLTKLQYLNLCDDDKITGAGFFLLTNLTNLNLCLNDSVKGTYFYRLTNITELDLAVNEMIHDDELSLLTNITKLNLMVNEKITNNGLGLLTNMVNLDLCQNEEITDNCLGLLTKLTCLNLEDNDMITDNSVSRLINLTDLDLTSNENITIGSVGFLTNLMRINIEMNANIIDEDLINLRTIIKQSNRKIMT